MLLWAFSSTNCFRIKSFQNSVNTKSSHQTIALFCSLPPTASFFCFFFFFFCFLTKRPWDLAEDRIHSGLRLAPLRLDAERKHKIWDVVFLLHEFISLGPEERTELRRQKTAHSQQKKNNTRAQIKVQGFSDSLKR